jgi:hypothetical protein
MGLIGTSVVVLVLQFGHGTRTFYSWVNWVHDKMHFHKNVCSIVSLK